MKLKMSTLRLVALHVMVLAGFLLMQGCATGQCAICALNWPYDQETVEPMILPPGGDYTIEPADSVLLPPMIDQGPATSYDVPAVAPSGQTYVVRKGDTLSAIASMYGTTWKRLAEYNGLSNPNRLVVGQEIQIPGGSSSYSAPVTRPAAPSKKSSSAVRSPITQGGSYVIQRGDTLSGIAARAGLSVSEIKAANALSGNLIIAGKSITIPKQGAVNVTVLPAGPAAPAKTAEPVVIKVETPGLAPIADLAPLAPSPSAPVYEHVLYPGETIEDVARQYGSSEDEILRLNGIADPAGLKPGTKLLVPIPE